MVLERLAAVVFPPPDGLMSAALRFSFVGDPTPVSMKKSIGGIAEERARVA